MGGSTNVFIKVKIWSFSPFVTKLKQISKEKEYRGVQSFLTVMDKTPKEKKRLMGKVIIQRLFA